MATFELEITVLATLTLDEHVINVVDDEWRSYLYNLNTPEEIAEHIAYNLLRGVRLHQLDGWTNQPDNNARLSITDMWFEQTQEISDKPTTQPAA